MSTSLSQNMQFLYLTCTQQTEICKGGKKTLNDNKQTQKSIYKIDVRITTKLLKQLNFQMFHSMLLAIDLSIK